jgi:hypothetical protein
VQGRVEPECHKDLGNEETLTAITKRKKGGAETERQIKMDNYMSPKRVVAYIP